MQKILRYLIMFFFVLLVVFPVYAEDKKGSGEETKTSSDAERKKIEEQWGIQVKGIRLTAADYMLDFRYCVTDSEKASSILNRQEKATLIHQENGTVMHVPTTRLGAMRQTSVRPAEGRDYLIFFANRNGLVKTGDKVTVMIGDFKIENLIVEE
ncbi:MAG: hypothetical protein RDU01_07420 [Thermodesulfovibrionales bacterium]|nr:hypothetical protein [Thermodesulfovibrionales bacterium]